MNNRELYEEIRQQVRVRFRRRRNYFFNLFVFLGVFIALINLLYVPIIGILMALWGLLLAAHTFWWVTQELEDRAVRRELERAGLLTERQLEKAKRGERLVTLSDDGELYDLYDDYYDEKHSYK